MLIPHGKYLRDDVKDTVRVHHPFHDHPTQFRLHFGRKLNFIVSTPTFRARNHVIGAHTCQQGDTHERKHVRKEPWMSVCVQHIDTGQEGLHVPNGEHEQLVDVPQVGWWRLCRWRRLWTWDLGHLVQWEMNVVGSHGVVAYAADGAGARVLVLVAVVAERHAGAYGVPTRRTEDVSTRW